MSKSSTTSDFFGSHLATTDLYVTDQAAVYEAAKRYYAEIMMPFRPVIRNNLTRSRPLNNMKVSGIITPNRISAARIALCPFLLLAAWLNHPHLFQVFFAVCLLSDFADGLLARIRNQQSMLGTRLDTWGDVSMFVCAALGAALLWPDLIRREGLFFAAALLLIGVSGTVSILKYQRLPTYHTWSAKVSTAVIGVAALLMFSGVSVWPFRLSVATLAVSAAEETGITFILPRWHPNVRGVFHALAIKRQMQRGDTDDDKN